MRAHTVSRLALAIALAGATAPAFAPARAQETDDPPTTTLPFEPTVPSAPPTRPTYPEPAQPAPPPPPPPGDPLCYEIGPIIRAGVVASRFATLSPGTAQGAAVGRHETGEALKKLGADYCAVTIPAASPVTAGSPYNQVTCRIETRQSDAPYLEKLREARAGLAERIAECPAVARWTGAAPLQSTLGGEQVIEDYVFTHPDVAVEIVIRARLRDKTGQWPLDYIETLSLIFRTPNPDRPDPPEPVEAAAGGD